MSLGNSFFDIVCLRNISDDIFHLYAVVGMYTLYIDGIISVHAAALVLSVLFCIFGWTVPNILHNEFELCMEGYRCLCAPVKTSSKNFNRYASEWKKYRWIFRTMA